MARKVPAPVTLSKKELLLLSVRDRWTEFFALGAQRIAKADGITIEQAEEALKLITPFKERFEGKPFGATDDADVMALVSDKTLRKKVKNAKAAVVEAREVKQARELENLRIEGIFSGVEDDEPEEKKAANTNSRDVVRWVSLHLAYDDIVMPDQEGARKAPSGEHWAMWSWARENTSEFYKGPYTKLIPTRSEIEKDQAIRDDGVMVLDMIEELLKEYSGAPVKVRG